jgi:NAD(P)-dependent dehydrogenase (short-subunit alcohol dehydrogenase family)
MKELHGKVAVITGAASGFGREFAIRCADEGMKVILTDIDTGGLGTTVALLKPGTESLVIGSDVSSADSVEHLAKSTYDRFGACHLLFNNAGVGTAGPIWTATLDDWKWTLGINVMGVVHGLRSFVPRMLAQKEESYIVNTASAAGLLAPPGSGVYAASKHAVVAITECLHHELRGQNAPIGVSVLCPAFVDTGISNSERNRPAELADSNPEAEQYSDRIRQAIKSGKLSAADIARITIDAVKDGRFYILTHPNVKIAVEIRMNDILLDRQPTNTSQR